MSASKTKQKKGAYKYTEYLADNLFNGYSKKWVPTNRVPRW